METFWNNLPAVIVAIGGFYAVYKQNQRLEAGLKNNTEITVAGQQGLYEKVDSATKDVNANVTTSANDVKKEAINTAKAGAVIALQTANTAKAGTQEVLQQLAPIAEKLNGGPGGLHEWTERVMLLEKKHDILVGGQELLAQGLNRLTGEISELTSAVNKKSNF